MTCLNPNGNCWGVTDEAYTSGFCPLEKKHVNAIQILYLMTSRPSHNTHKLIWPFCFRRGSPNYTWVAGTACGTNTSCVHS